MKYETMNNLITEYSRIGRDLGKEHHFFDNATMKFFGSRLQENCYINDNAPLWYFVTSERRPDSGEKRRFTVRCFNRKTGSIDTVGKFQQYSYLAPAEKEAKRLACEPIRQLSETEAV